MKGFRPIIVVMVILVISCSVLTYIVIANYQGKAISALQINDIGKILILLTDLVLLCIFLTLFIVFLHQNLLYLQIVIDKVYNFFEAKRKLEEIFL